MSKEKYILKKLNKKEESSDEQAHGQEYEYEYDVPGPGYYDYNQFPKKDFRSTKQEYQKIFYSLCQRFHEKNPQN